MTNKDERPTGEVAAVVVTPVETSVKERRLVSLLWAVSAFLIAATITWVAVIGANRFTDVVEENRQLTYLVEDLTQAQVIISERLECQNYLTSVVMDYNYNYQVDTTGALLNGIVYRLLLEEGEENFPTDEELIQTVDGGVALAANWRAALEVREDWLEAGSPLPCPDIIDPDN